VTACPECGAAPVEFDLETLAELYPTPEGERLKLLTEPDYEPRPRRFDCFRCFRCRHRFKVERTP
jgi:hypothetical protein